MSKHYDSILYILYIYVSTQKWYSISMKEGGGMALTDAQKRAVAKYNEKAYDRIEVKVYKGQKDKIKAHAESKGMSLNAYINDLIEKDMNK